MKKILFLLLFSISTVFAQSEDCELEVSLEEYSFTKLYLKYLVLQDTPQTGATELLALNQDCNVVRTPIPEPVVSYIGSTDSNGEYTIAYTNSYLMIPNVQVTIVTSNPKDEYMLTSSTTSGFSVLVQRREDFADNLPSYTDLSGVPVNVIVRP